MKNKEREGGMRIKKERERERHEMPAAYYNAAMSAGLVSNMQRTLRTSESMYCCTYD